MTVGPTALEFIGVAAGTALVALAMFAVVLLVAPQPTTLDQRMDPGRTVGWILAWFVPTVGCAWFLSSLIVY